MKSVSLKNLFEKAIATLLRFPLTMLFAAIGVVVAFRLIDKNISVDEDVSSFNIIAICALGLSVFFSLHMLMGKLNKNRMQQLLIVLGGLAFLAGVFFSLPSTSMRTAGAQPAYLRLFVFFVCAHLLASFIPFIKNKNLNGFWQYNRRLFIRFLTAGLYSAVLFVGILLALLAISELFEVKFDNNIYPKIWMVIAGLFNTWIFLAGVPQDFAALDEEKDYPKGLRIFAQYILLPLLALYLIILYAYGAKIVGQWNWPKGIISYLVICVSAIGSLNFLLLYPYGETEEHRWIKTTGKTFYILMLPLMVLLFIAISMRLSDYGITMHRYIVFMMGLWLTIVSLYTISGRANIRFIPISLSIVLLLSIFGPWSMFSVSERSQVNRLEQILKKGGLLKNDKIVNENLLPSGKVNNNNNLDGLNNSLLLNDSLKLEVSSILNYIKDIDRLESVNPWFTQNMDSLKKNMNPYSITDLYMQAMGLQKELGVVEVDEDAEAVNRVDIEVDKSMEAIPVSGYDIIYKINDDDYIKQSEDMNIGSFNFDGQRYQLNYTSNDHAGIVFSNNTDSTTFYLDSLIDEQEKNNEKRKLAQDKMTFKLSTTSSELKLIVTELYADKKVNVSHQKTYEILTLKGWLLIKKK